MAGKLLFSGALHVMQGANDIASPHSSASVLLLSLPTEAQHYWVREVILTGLVSQGCSTQSATNWEPENDGTKALLPPEGRS